MKKDSVIKDIVSDIQSQAKDRFKINLTESTIYEVIEWQFKEVADAMKELEEIRLPFFGTFVPKSNKGQKIEKSPTESTKQVKPKKNKFLGISLTDDK
jgi:nucleoid DNA-binding protein